MTLDEARANIGVGVTYRPPGGVIEDGVITSVNARWVFVRYRGDNHSKATHPRDLEWLSRAVRPSDPDGVTTHA